MMVEQVSTIEAPQNPRPKPRFILSESSSVINTYNSFAKEGFAHLMSSHAEFPYNFEKKFLSKVDLTKGPILVSVGMMIRTMAVDCESPKRERKEYLTYTTEWEAKDRLDNPIRCGHEHEGKFTQQSKFIKTKYNSSTKEEEAYYEKGAPRDVYTIPWNKKTADSILTGEKYFGEDSINTTHLDEVQYTVKFSGNPSKTSFGMSDFLDFKYEKLQELSRTVKSPYLADLERRVNPYK
jgi:hypothetical protein